MRAFTDIAGRRERRRAGRRHSAETGVGVWLILGLMLLVSLPVAAQEEEKEDRPEHPALGPVRLMPDQPFIGRIGRQEYKNYGFEDYSRRPAATSNLSHRYNLLGDPLVYGTQSIRWVESRGLGTSRGYSSVSEGGSHGTSRGGTASSPGGSFANLFNYVMVGSDGTDSWQARAIYANELRSKFTPLTFKMSNVDGLRLDVGTEHDKFSALFSNLTPTGGGFIVPTTMLGAHYERRVGFLNFGASFVNAHQFEHQMSNRHQSLKGSVGNIQRPTAMVAVRISDGSPQDGRGRAGTSRIQGLRQRRAASGCRCLRPTSQPARRRPHHVRGRPPRRRQGQ